MRKQRTHYDRAFKENAVNLIRIVKYFVKYFEQKWFHQKPKTMKTKVFYLAFLFFFHIALYSQTDTLKLKAEYNIPFKIATSGMNLAYDGTDLWISEHLSGDIYRINTNGICLDTINSFRTTRIESVGGDLWIIHDY